MQYTGRENGPGDNHCFLNSVAQNLFQLRLRHAQTPNLTRIGVQNDDDLKPPTKENHTYISLSYALPVHTHTTSEPNHRSGEQAGGQPLLPQWRGSEPVPAQAVQAGREPDGRAQLPRPRPSRRTRPLHSFFSLLFTLITPGSFVGMRRLRVEALPCVVARFCAEECGADY